MYKQQQEHTKKPWAMCNFENYYHTSQTILNHFLNGFIYTILMQGEYQRY